MNHSLIRTHPFGPSSGFIKVGLAQRVMLFTLAIIVILILLPAIAQGEDADSREQQLREAAAYGDLGTVKKLLAQGAAIDGKDSFSGRTALIYSAWAGCFDVVRLLLEKGASVAIKDNDGNTVLSWAAREDHTAVAALLRANGATMTLGEAICLGDVKQFKKLIKQIPSGHDVVGLDGLPALVWAAKTGHPQIVKLLLDRGAWVDAKNWGGLTALMFAANGGHTEVVALLLQHGADADANRLRVDRPGWGCANGARRSSRVTA